jgi:HEPN domain-containing protein
MSSAESNFLAWLRKANHDLLNIENNLAAKDIPWDTVCFHAQQVAEKVLKAFLVHHRYDLLKTHDLVALLAQCVNIDCTL